MFFDKYLFTENGKRIAEDYIKDLASMRKEILDAGKDTANETQIPSLSTIEADINFVGINWDDPDGACYYNGWGVTDNYDAVDTLLLKYGRDFINAKARLVRMSMLLEMDRPIAKGAHYIMPGGYEVGGKHFDFNQSEGYVDEDNPTQITFILKDFDNSLGDKEETVVTPEDLKLGFTEFYVYTGEYDDPEIRVKEVKEVVFTFRDPESELDFDIKGSDDLLRGINACVEGKRAYYYLSCTTYRDEESKYFADTFEGFAGIYYCDEAEDPSLAGEFYDDEQGSISTVEYFNSIKELDICLDNCRKSSKDFNVERGICRLCA